MVAAPARSPEPGWPCGIGCGLAGGKLVVLDDALAAPPDGRAPLAALPLGATGVVLGVGQEPLQQRRGRAGMGG